MCHKTIKSRKDQDALQEDLNSLAAWEQKWLMSFHPDKCQTLRVTRKREPLPYEYTLRDHTLETVPKAKYLGVTISSDLSWTPHICNIVNRANRTLGLLRRNLKVRSQSIKKQAYETLVRPTLEYASSVWDPYTKNDTKMLEAVQRRAARWVTRKYRKTLSVQQMMDTLQWPSLQERRRKARLTNFYKFHNKSLTINTCHKPIPNSSDRKETRNSHPAGYRNPRGIRSYRQNSFFPRTVNDWNSLPAETALSTTLEGFKSAI